MCAWHGALAELLTKWLEVIKGGDSNRFLANCGSKLRFCEFWSGANHDTAINGVGTLHHFRFHL